MMPIPQAHQIDTTGDFLKLSLQQCQFENLFPHIFWGCTRAVDSVQELQLPVELKAMAWCITMPRNGRSAPVGLSLFWSTSPHFVNGRDIFRTSISTLPSIWHDVHSAGETLVLENVWVIHWPDHLQSSQRIHFSSQVTIRSRNGSLMFCKKSIEHISKCRACIFWAHGKPTCRATSPCQFASNGPIQLKCWHQVPETFPWHFFCSTIALKSSLSRTYDRPLPSSSWRLSSPIRN